MDQTTTTTSTRDAHGRFMPGCSGNPAGRAPGSINKATALRRQLAEGDTDEAARRIIQKMKDGDMAAARFILLHGEAKPRGRAVDFDITEDMDLGLAQRKMLLRMKAGELTLDEGDQLGRVLERVQAAEARCDRAASKGRPGDKDKDEDADDDDKSRLTDEWGNRRPIDRETGEPMPTWAEADAVAHELPSIFAEAEVMTRAWRMETFKAEARGERPPTPEEFMETWHYDPSKPRDPASVPDAPFLQPGYKLTAEVLAEARKNAPIREARERAEAARIVAAEREEASRLAKAAREAASADSSLMNPSPVAPAMGEGRVGATAPADAPMPERVDAPVPPPGEPLRASPSSPMRDDAHGGGIQESEDAGLAGDHLQTPCRLQEPSPEALRPPLASLTRSRALYWGGSKRGARALVKAAKQEAAARRGGTDAPIEPPDPAAEAAARRYTRS